MSPIDIAAPRDRERRVMRNDTCTCGHDLRYRDSHYRNMHRAYCRGPTPHSNETQTEDAVRRKPPLRGQTALAVIHHHGGLCSPSHAHVLPGVTFKPFSNEPVVSRAVGPTFVKLEWWER